MYLFFFQTHLTFGSEFTQAVEQKQVAQQDAERARYLVEKVKNCFPLEVFQCAMNLTIALFKRGHLQNIFIMPPTIRRIVKRTYMYSVTHVYPSPSASVVSSLLLNFYTPTT